jgi:tartrate/fumarate subfamily iron-sulfur-dependent hydro-lyase alpha chain
MPTPAFFYQDPLPLGPDETSYRLLTKDGVSTTTFEGREILKVAPETLAYLAQQAFHDTSFFLRSKHVAQVAAILEDPAASPNDRYVALTLLKNAEIAARGILPMCQDTGTATIVGKKGQQVWTGANDAEWLSRGVYDCYTKENLRYSLVAPLDLWKEVNTGTNLPAQIDLYAAEGAKYEFLFVAKGGGSANKLFLYQETKALLNPKSLEKFVTDKLQYLGTSACPPYHLVFVIGGTSAENCMKVLKLATTKYLDALPTTGNEHGRAFRDLEWEKKILEIAQNSKIGAQFGGKYFALDVRVVRLPRHGASCPVGMGVSCSADRNIKAKITADGVWIEEMETNPGRFIPEADRRFKDNNIVKIDRKVTNIVTGEALTGTTVVVSNAESSSLYGARTLALELPIVSTLGADTSYGQNQAKDLALFLASQYANPELRPDGIRFAPQGRPNQLYPALLARKIRDRVNVIFDVPGGGEPVVRDCFVESINHTMTPGNWSTTLGLSSATFYTGFFILDNTDLGELNQNKLAY